MSDTNAPRRELLTQTQIRAQYLPVDVRTFYRWIASGRFPRADISDGRTKGRRLRFWLRETVESWIEAQRRAA